LRSRILEASAATPVAADLLDPDGTRAEIMELHAIGTPCCFCVYRHPIRRSDEEMHDHGLQNHLEALHPCVAALLSATCT